MPLAQAESEQSTQQSFEEHARAVIQNVRSTLAELLNAVGADATRSQDMARRFGVNKNLAWKISRIIREDDPFAVPPLIPGRPGLNIFFRSVRKVGAPAQAVDSVKAALTEFDRLIDVHSGDRETLEMMLGGLTRNGLEWSETTRKLAFRGNSATWGVQARVQLTTNIIAPGSDADWVDLAWISGLVDFRRLRPDVAWAMASARKALDDGTVLPVGMIEAIDAGFSGEDTAPLLGEFCTQPMPEIRITTTPQGIMRYELVEGPVGNVGATTCLIGLFGRNFVRRYRVPDDTIGEHLARLSTPVETQILDLFVHRDLDYAHEPEVALHSQLPGGPVYPVCGHHQGLLPLYETLQELGPPTEIVMPELPRYRQMLETVFTRLNWQAAEFLGFRLKIRYPPIPSLGVLRYELPEKPET